MLFYRRNLKKYGEKVILAKLAEECKELEQACYRRLCATHKLGQELYDDEIAEEMADVYILSRQLRTLEKYNRFRYWKRFKIKRQKRRWKNV